MIEFLTKVDRVKSQYEAIEMQDLNVDYITVCLNKDHRYSDSRVINVELATRIRSVLKSAKYVGEINVQNYNYDLLSLINEIGFDCIQVAGNTVPSIDFQNNETTSNVGSDLLTGNKLWEKCTGITMEDCISQC